MSAYQNKTTEELVKLYADEHNRINASDKARTQELIKQALVHRFNAFINLLDDDQTTNNPIGTYNYLLGK